MYRLRSTDVWFNAPGIVAAYQPVAAPDALAARQNVGSDLRMAGRHTAQPGVLPTHDPKTGWGFAGQYLLTGIIPNANTNVIARFSDIVGATGWVIGRLGATPRFGIAPKWSGYGTVVTYERGAGQAYIGVEMTKGVLAMSGTSAYRNGIYDGAVPAWTGTATSGLAIGAYNDGSSPFYGKIQAVAIASITLTPAHIAQYSRQMAYCHVNPDWSAWSRRRRYYYAPSAAGIVLWRGVGRNSSPVGGSPGIGRST